MIVKTGCETDGALHSTNLQSTNQQQEEIFVRVSTLPSAGVSLQSTLLCIMLEYLLMATFE